MSQSIMLPFAPSMAYREPLCYELTSCRYHLEFENGAQQWITFLDEQTLLWQTVGEEAQYSLYACIKCADGLYFIGISQDLSISSPLGLILDIERRCAVLLTMSERPEDPPAFIPGRLIIAHDGKEPPDRPAAMYRSLFSHQLLWRVGPGEILEQLFQSETTVRQAFLLGGHPQEETAARYALLPLRDTHLLLCTGGQPLKQFGEYSAFCIHLSALRSAGCTWKRKGDLCTARMFSAYGAFVNPNDSHQAKKEQQNEL